MLSSLRPALRVITGLLLAGMVLEFCARLDDFAVYGAPLWSAYNSEILYKWDALGKTGKPGARYKKWQLNSLGFRGPELKPGGIRIVCFGSSETFGLYEAPNEEFPRQLESDLNARAEGQFFQIVNAAYPGETLATTALRVPEIVRQVRPQVAVIYPSVAAYIFPPPAHVAAPPPTARFELRIVDKSRDLLKQLLPRGVQNYLREREIRRWAEANGSEARLPEENMRRFASDLTELITSLRAAGVEPVLVTHATRFGETIKPGARPWLVAWRRFYPMLQENGFLDMENRANDIMRHLGAVEEVTVIDAAHEIPPGQRNFADFVHFTSTGAALMAQDLADGLGPVILARCGGTCLKVPKNQPRTTLAVSRAN